ncbi:MAG: hypothetical protein HC837_15940 [Chloroflexaceae bacterium]|nr:hypothetical protein [Chloroflexaceae bacterium]
MIEFQDQRIDVHIPPGVRHGSRVRLAGQGYPSEHGTEMGDLFLLIQVAPHPHFQVDGLHLFTDVPVDVYTAILGGSVRLATLNGSVLLAIPPQTQAGTTFRLSGQGLPDPDQHEQRGNLYARVQLVLPEQLSQAEVETLRVIARAYQFAVAERCPEQSAAAAAESERYANTCL